MHLGLSVCPFSSALTHMSVSCSRPFSCSSREEMPALRHHPSPHWGDSGCKAGSGGASVPSGGPGPLDPPRQASRTPCPLPLSSGAHGHLPDARAAPLSSVLSAPGPSSYCSQAAAQPSTPAGTPRSGSGHSPAQPPSPERKTEERAGMRASPPWMKRTYIVREESLPEDPPKHYPKPQDAPSSSSTSDPDTPLGAPGIPGRISLRISESALLASPPPREDCEDDEVFVRDPRPTATSSPRCDELLLPPPPPPPPPTTSQASLAQGLDHFPPPPPEAVCPAQWEEGYLEPRAR